ncbi:MAG: MFS transporter [Alphaproteobacteria bacterium]|nr:MFS transporter [Alphaproteobacteria bacterium]
MAAAPGDGRGGPLPAPGDAAGPPPRASRQLLISLIVACALFMQNLDSTIIATALPVIARSLNESPLRLNVAITCYLLSLAVFIPISGWTADRFGARRVFSSAIVVFTIGSIGCGCATSLVWLVLARIVQGMGGAMMVPVGRLVLLKTVPKSELVRAMSYVSVPALIGPVIGPPLGGLIVTYASWRWIFFINVPVCVLGVVLVNLVIDNLRETGARPFDFLGFALTGVGLASLAFGFETIGRGALPVPVALALIAGGALCTALYIRHAHHAAHPIIDLALLRIPTYATTTAGGFLFRMGLGALPFLMPLMLQVGFGLDPLSSGLLTFASAAGAMTMKITVAPIIRAFGFRRVLVGNAAISSLFLFGYSFFRPSTPHFVIFAALLAGGFFRSLQMTSINTLSYADVPPPLLSRATSLTSMAQQLSQSVGVGTGATLLHLMLVRHGGTALTPGDFSFAFAAVGVISMLSVPFFLRMSPDAGAEVRGRPSLR